MHLPGKKNTLPVCVTPSCHPTEILTIDRLQDISSPQDARPLDDQSQPRMFNAGETSTNAENAATAPAPMQTHGLSNPQPDPRHVYQPGANQPAGATDMHDPKLGVEAGQLPPGQNGPTMMDDQPVEVGETKMPFKDQVRAYTQIHRGTLRGDHEQKERGKKMLAGEIPVHPE